VGYFSGLREGEREEKEGIMNHEDGHTMNLFLHGENSLDTDPVRAKE
jgi:hypothetical protein